MVLPSGDTAICNGPRATAQQGSDSGGLEWVGWMCWTGACGGVRRPVIECLASEPPGPAHPRDRGLGVVAKLLCNLFRTTEIAECANGYGNCVPHLLGTGVLTALQCRHEQGIGPHRADAEGVYR